MKNPIEQRLYKIESEPGHFYAGHLDNGNQLLMRVDISDLIGVQFDASGNFINVLSKRISQETLTNRQEAIVKSKWSAFHGDWDELDRWVTELGLKKGVITIKKLSLPEQDLRIVDIPEIYQEIIDSGNKLDEETLESIQYWQEENDFVLVWSQDYDMDKDGRVVST